MTTKKPKPDAHVILVPSTSSLIAGTLLCLHCGTNYAMASPVPIDVFSGATTAFDKTHKKCRLSPKGKACPHCFAFGHEPTSCPKTAYAGDLEKWRSGPDTGSSSLAIFDVLVRGVEPARPHDYPYDPSDFGRCYRFLKAFLQLRARIGEMGNAGLVWGQLTSNWDDLEALYLEEVPNHNGPAPRLYARLQALRKLGGEP